MKKIFATAVLSILTLLALAQGSVAADEVALVEGDVMAEVRHLRRIRLRELGRPDAVALLQPQAVERAVADGLETEVGARFA